MEKHHEEQHPNPPTTSPADAESQAPHEMSPEERLSAALQEIEALRNEKLRILADTENFKKRLLREKDEQCKFAVSGLVEELLVVLDNLELALSHCRSNEACQDLLTGVDMTRSAMLDVLRRHGLTPIAVEPGAAFDPNLHEALGHEVRDDLEPGVVARVLQTGYTLKERLLRPAKVMISTRKEAQ